MSISRAAGLVFALTIVGCGGGTTEVDATESGKATSMRLLFEDHYSDTGAMLVFDSGSSLVLQVYGGIGQDDPVAMGALLASADLAGVYLKLHPEAQSAPEALVNVARRWDEALSVAVRPSLEQRGEGALTDKSFSTFINSTCQPFSAAGGTWTPNQCRYSDGVYTIGQQGAIQYPSDRAFIWNDTPGQAEVVGYSWWGGVPFYMGYLHAWTWSWLSAGPHTGSGPPGGSFDPLTVGAQVGVAQAGSLGITHHWFKATIE
jgi:hypothetical protein